MSLILPWEIGNTSVTEGGLSCQGGPRVSGRKKALDDERSIEAANRRADCLVKPTRMVARDGRFSLTVHKG